MYSINVKRSNLRSYATSSSSNHKITRKGCKNHQNHIFMDFWNPSRFLNEWVNQTNYEEGFLGTGEIGYNFNSQMNFLLLKVNTTHFGSISLRHISAKSYFSGN